MPEEKRSGEAAVPVWGIFLFFIGIVLLLQTLNLLPWGLWGVLWRFWPVILILIGLGILLRKYNFWLVSLALLALLFASLGIALWQYQSGVSPPPTAQGYSQPRDGLERARVEIDLAMGNLSLSGLPAGSANLVEADTGDTLEARFQRQGSEGTLCLERGADFTFWREGEERWQARLHPGIPLAVRAKMSLGNLNLDLSELRVRELRLETELGNTTVKMPSSGVLTANIKANLANLEVTVPKGVALRLRAASDLSTLEVDQSRFPQKGDYYQSPDFESTTSRIEMELKANLSRAVVK
ncbi:MAG: DUF5668 domain-containing protein [Chloroflexota bacterium]